MTCPWTLVFPQSSRLALGDMFASRKVSEHISSHRYRPLFILYLNKYLDSNMIRSKPRPVKIIKELIDLTVFSGKIVSEENDR